MSAFKFTKLTVNKVPGIDDGFCLDGMSPGINIVVGPNGSGKTSTRRALDAVLWPAKSEDHKKARLNLSAESECGAGSYRTHLQFGTQPSFKDGRSCDPISFGNPELKDQYHLSLHDLVQDDGGQFAKFISDLSVGGVDLDACAKEIGAKSRHNSPTEDVKLYSRVKEEIARLKIQANEAKELESQLAEMHKSAESLQQRLLLHPLYSAALEHADALSLRDVVKSSLDEFPVQLKGITGIEYEALVGIDNELDEVRVRQSRLERELNTAQSRIAASQLGGNISALVVTSLNSYADRLTEARAKAKDAELKVKQCEARVEGLRNSIFDVKGIDRQCFASLSDISSALIDDLIKVGKDLNKIDAEINHLKGEIGAAQESETDESLPSKSSIESGVQALGQWLQANNSQEADEKTFHMSAAKVRNWGIVTAILCLIGGVFSGIAAVESSGGSGRVYGITAALLFAIVAAAQVALILWFRKMDKKGAANQIQQIANQSDSASNQAVQHYSRTGLLPPNTWTTVDVAVQINRLSEIRSKVASIDLVELRMRSLRERLNIKERERELLIADAERSLSAIQYDDDELPNLGYISEFLKQIREYQLARIELTEARVTAESMVKDANDFAASIDDTLTSCGLVAVAGDIVKLKATLKYIEQQVHDFSTATTLFQEKSSDSKQLLESFTRLSDRRVCLFKSAGLVDGDSVQLKHLCAQYKQYQECVIEMSIAEKQLERAHDRVVSDPLYNNAIILKSTKGELEAEIDALSTEEASLKRLNGEISKIEVSLKAAETASGMEIALAQLDTVTARINQYREADLSKLLGQVIIDHVKAVTYDSHRPVVLQRACALFTSITHGKYELRFGGEEFHVLDTEGGLELAVDELSCGTKVQLQIAVRLAFVEEQEEGDKLPLFLDETLGTSDDYRAQAIIDSIIMLAKQGRQIFYFTAQTDEVGKWIESLKTEGLEYRLFELDKLRKLSRLNPEARAVNISPVSLPSIEVDAETTHLDYGRAIGVPPIRIGHDDVGRVPLWYVIDDPAKLHSLRTVSIETFGPLVSMHKNGRNFPVKGFDSLSAKLPAIERLISATIKAINIGHGKRVDRAVLISSPVSRSKLFEQIVGLAEQVEGDASELLDALRGRAVSGLQTQLISSLEEHLRDEGCFLDDEQPLTSDGIRAFIVEEVSDDLYAGALSIAEIHSFVDRVNNPPK